MQEIQCRPGVLSCGVSLQAHAANLDVCVGLRARTLGALGDSLAAQGVIVKAETMVRAVGGPNADVVNLGYTVFDYVAMRHADYASSS